MRVRVLFFGQIKDITGKAEEEVQVLEGSDLQGLFESYAGRFPRLGAMRHAVVLARNHEFGDSSVMLADGDEVAFLPPVSGGSHPTKPEAEPTAEPSAEPDIELVAIVREPIDTRALVTLLQRAEDGAVVVFEGVVRNHSGGKATLYLEYEAYEPMALEQMRVLAREARRRWPIDRIGILHRLGRLEIGETSVAIVVTSAHRHPAFEVCRYAIDRLKKTVPIWKKEYFADGAIWADGEWDKAFVAQVPGRSSEAPTRKATVEDSSSAVERAPSG